MQEQYGFHMKLPLKMVKRKKWFVASCPILDLYSQGETEEMAKQNLIETVCLFIITCFEAGTLDDVLKECGFSKGQKRIQSKKLDFIDVPIPFPLEKGKNVECRV